MANLPAPKNTLVAIVNAVLDCLIKGVGVDLAIAEAVALWPPLGFPVVSWIFRQIVEAIADSIDTNAKDITDILVIRFQNDERKAAYDQAIEKIKSPNATAADIQAAKDALERLVRRAR